MQKFHNESALVEDVREAIEHALQLHGVDNYSPLGIGAVLSASASPFKWAIYPHHPLLVEAAHSAFLAFLQSRLAFDVALAQSPHSLIVNPLMEAAANAALTAKKPLSFEDLRRNAFRVHLKTPTMNVRGVNRAMAQNSSLEPAFDSALAYLEEAGILERVHNGTKWCLGEQYAYAASKMAT